MLSRCKTIHAYNRYIFGEMVGSYVVVSLFVIVPPLFFWSIPHLGSWRWMTVVLALAVASRFNWVIYKKVRDTIRSIKGGFEELKELDE